MANFVVVVDQDVERRQGFLNAAREKIAPLKNLEVGQAGSGDLAMVWARGKNAPLSGCVNHHGAALLIGYAIDEQGERPDAAQLLDRWGTDTRRLSEVLDGYFSAVTYDRHNQLTMGGDILGLFPLYYFTHDGVLLAGSSPEVFRYHPLYRSQLDVTGLVGMFLVGSLLGGRSLLVGVRRLGAGNLLRWNPRDGAREVANYRLRTSDRYQGRTFEEHVEIAEEAFERALQRHAPPEGRAGLMLSGGLDSRLLAGYLTRVCKAPLAYCLGADTDLEAVAARRTAQALDCPFHLESREPDQEQYVELAEKTATWEHVSAGMSGLEFWRDGESLGELAPSFWSGFYLDGLMGAESVKKAYDPATGKILFERFYRNSIQIMGMAPANVARLLTAHGGRSLVDDVYKTYHAEYLRGEGADYQRVLRMRLATDIRYTVGTAWWRLSFQSWPLMPNIDRRFLETVIDLPHTELLGRKLQREMLQRRFPALARIPLDNGTHRFEPVQAGSIDRMWGTINRKLSLDRFWHRWYWKGLRGLDRRRWHRVFDFNSPQWRAVRRRAEPLRDKLHGLLDRQELNRLLPSPETHLPARSKTEYAPRRTLLGLMLWSEKHL